MSAPVCQFVDRVGTGAVTRLNLNDGKQLRLLIGPDQRPGPDFSPPALKRAVVNTLLAEGATIPASAYDNRIIRLPLRAKACNEEEMAEILESLHRELDRGNNILKWHPTYNSWPVYFRTFRSPDYRLDQTSEGAGELRATLALVAEPFAYGDYVEETGTIYNDPAAVANGIHFEIAAVEGDVPTPLFLYLTETFVGDVVLASRRHGTPAVYWSQCEAMVQGIDTTTQPNDANMSGAGQNFSRTTFVNPAMVTRLTWNNVPGAGDSQEYRGLYRVFGCIRRSDNSSDINVKMVYGNPLFERDAVVTGKWTARQLVDFGLLPIPAACDPVYDGYTNIVLPVENIPVYFRAERTAGAGTLDWDYVVLMPADEEFSIFDFPGTPATAVIDGPNNMVFSGDMLKILTEDLTPFVGSIPLVSPDQVNLYLVLHGIDANFLTFDLDYIARYWPRYLYIR